MNDRDIEPSMQTKQKDLSIQLMRDKQIWTRRRWLSAATTSVVGAAIGGAAVRATEDVSAGQQQQTAQGLPLRLTEFEPKSMLHVKETRVPRARFPVIDFHSHVSWRPAQKPRVPPAELVKTMDAVNLHTMVNLTGGSGEDFVSTVKMFDRAFPKRFVSMTEPAWTRASESGYAAWQGEEIGKAKTAGAVVLKILKTLGLYLRDGGPTGKLVRIDDARFDPMWDACGRLGLPV